MKYSKKQIDKIDKALITAYHEEQEAPRLSPYWKQKLMEEILSRARGDRTYDAESAKTMGYKKFITLATAVVIASFLVWLTVANLDFYDPWITIQPDVANVHRNIQFLVKAGDKDSGLRTLQVIMIQQKTEIRVLSRDFKSESAIKEVELPLVFDPQTLGLHSGEATILIVVHDLSWRNWFQGRITTLKQKVSIGQN
jgi:hypothetical protein